MPLQTNIHPFRWLAACVGIQWGEVSEMEALESTLPTVANILGVGQEQILEFVSQSRNRLEEAAPRLADPRELLSMDIHSRDALVELKKKFDSITPERFREFAKRLEAWIAPRLLVPPDDLVLLQPYIVMEWMLRAAPDKVMRASVRSSQMTMYQLVDKRAEQVRAAFKTFLPFGDPMTPEGQSFLQAQGRIMHNVMISLQERGETVGSRRFAIKSMLEAWREAYENTILEVCRFLHAVTHKNSRRANGEEKSAGQVFNEVRQWFKRAGIDFPFFENLVTVRNKLSHRPWSIVDDERKVYFGHPGHAKTVVLSFEEVETMAWCDIWIAFYFPHGTLMALLEYDNQNGRFDPAWRRLEAATSGGVLAVFDKATPANDIFGVAEFDEKSLVEAQEVVV